MNLNFDTGIVNVAARYAEILDIKVTSTSLKEALKQDPYYPSLYSISNAFNRFGITNESFRVPREEFHQLEAPFLAYASHSGAANDFVLVTSLTDVEVHYETGNNKPHKVTREQFLNDYKEVVFAAEAGEKSGERDFEVKLKKEKRSATKKQLLITGSLLVSGLILVSLFSPLVQHSNWSDVWSISFIAFGNLIGLTAAILLLIYETDKTNSFVKNICRAGKQTNCDAVLKSKAGKIAGVSWAELGFFYFASTILFLLLPGVSVDTKVIWLALAASLASPYILFSLYYQWRVVKQWCPLCLAAQVALVLELIWSISVFSSANSISVPDELTPAILLAAICVLLPVITWYLLKPVFLEAKDANTYSAAYKRLLYNPEIFNALLQKQSSAPDGWQNLGICIGNPNAANTILKVCNPYCGPCAKAHPVLEEIVTNNPDYNIRIIFTSTKNVNDRGGAVVKHLLALDTKGNKEETVKAVHEWYSAEQKNYEAFAVNYPMNGELKLQDEKIDAMVKWCEQAEIAYTPTLFVKGQRLPETYSVEELKNIL